MRNVEVVLQSVASNKWCYILIQTDHKGGSKPFCLLPPETDMETIYSLVQLVSNAGIKQPLKELNNEYT